METLEIQKGKPPLRCIRLEILFQEAYNPSTTFLFFPVSLCTFSCATVERHRGEASIVVNANGANSISFLSVKRETDEKLVTAVNCKRGRGTATLPLILLAYLSRTLFEDLSF